MLALVLAAALSQAPVKIAVVQSSNLGVPAKRAAELTAQLLKLMADEKLAPVEAKLPCDNRACLVATGKELRAAAVFSVAFAALGKDTVMDLECVQTSDGRSLGQATFTAKPVETKLPIEAVSFVAEVYRALKSTAVVADAPKREPDPVLVPDPNQPPTSEVVVEGPERSRVPAIAIGVGAVAVGVAAIVLLAMASGEAKEANRSEGTSPDGRPLSVYTREQASALRSSANGKYTASMGLGIGAGVLTATAMVLFVY